MLKTDEESLYILDIYACNEEAINNILKDVINKINNGIITKRIIEKIKQKEEVNKHFDLKKK